MRAAPAIAMTKPPPTTPFLMAPLEGDAAALLALVRADEVPEVPAEADEPPLVAAPTAAVPVDWRGVVAVAAVG